MVTELGIAKKNYKMYSEEVDKEMGNELEFLNYCEDHKETLQRWLEFLEEYSSPRIFDLTLKEIREYNNLFDKKIGDLQKAIKFYEGESI